MTGPLRVLTDDDVRAVVDAPTAVAAARTALLASANGRLTGPPRLAAPAGSIDLVFTVGGERSGPVGFRCYGTWDEKGDQLTAIWRPDGRLRGVVTGDELGTRRTAGLGGVAVDVLARRGAATLAVLGAGTMAWSQTWAACAVRAFGQVRVHSPREASRQRFAERVTGELGVPAVACDGAEEAVRGADVVLVCTVATQPVLEAGWLAPGCHVGSTGPKTGGASELDPEIAVRADVVVSDSPAQAAAGPPPWFSPRRPDPLADVVAGRAPGRTSDDQLTLYCSTGLAGSEVVLADLLFDRLEAPEVRHGALVPTTPDPSGGPLT